jgi:hypothetical protein
MMGLFSVAADAIARAEDVNGDAFAMPPKTAKAPSAIERKIAGVRDIGALHSQVFDANSPSLSKFLEPVTKPRPECPDGATDNSDGAIGTASEARG